VEVNVEDFFAHGVVAVVFAELVFLVHHDESERIENYGAYLVAQVGLDEDGRVDFILVGGVRLGLGGVD
jgi:hypothetical protein